MPQRSTAQSISKIQVSPSQTLSSIGYIPLLHLLHRPVRPRSIRRYRPTSTHSRAPTVFAAASDFDTVRISLRDTFDNVVSYGGIYAGMEDRTKGSVLVNPASRRAKCEDARSKLPLIICSIESVAPDASVGEPRQPVEVVAQTSPPQSLHTGVGETAVPEGESPAVSPPDVMDASALW